jgi:tetratricopeptide (TPR) repeat protein
MRFMRLLALALLVVLPAACGQGGGEDDLDAIREAYVQGFYLEARTGYERYLQLHPQGGHRKEAWQRLLEISLNVTGDTKRSISLLEAMILEFGQDREATWGLMNRLGALYEQIGDYPQSLAAREKSLEFAGDDTGRIVETRLAMARTQRTQREYDLAARLFARCAEQAPDAALRALCRYEEAQTYTFMQSWGQAKEVLEAMMADEPGDPDVHAQAVFLLADVYEQEMNFAKARQLFESIRETYPNPMVVEIRLKNLGRTKP